MGLSVVTTRDKLAQLALSNGPNVKQTPEMPVDGDEENPKLSVLY